MEPNNAKFVAIKQIFIIWFSIFANSAFDIISTGDNTQFNNIFSSLFIFLGHFPQIFIAPSVARRYPFTHYTGIPLSNNRYLL